MTREIEMLKQKLREHGDLARAPAPPKGKGKAPGKDVSQHGNREYPQFQIGDKVFMPGNKSGHQEGQIIYAEPVMTSLSC